jgi:predicted dehydrogenase
MCSTRQRPRGTRCGRRGLIVQVGTQHRSEPFQGAVRARLAAGALGKVSKVEIVWNYNGPRSRGRPEVKRDPRRGDGLAPVASDQVVASL